MPERPQGENKTSMPDKGTRTAVTDTYGADISGSATNKESGSTGGNMVSPQIKRCD